MKVSFNALFFLFLWACSANCQEVKLMGEILDFETNEPIESVTIVESNSMNGTISDNLGKFQLILKEKNTKLEFHFVGYYQLEIMNIQSIKELEIQKIKMVRDYSKYINVEGAKDINPDMRKHERIEAEVNAKYRIEICNEFYEPKIIGDKIVFDLKKK